MYITYNLLVDFNYICSNDVLFNTISKYELELKQTSLNNKCKMKECTDCAIRSKAVNTLSKEEFKFHSENCAELVLEAGETIFKEGQLSSHIAYLKSGLAKINKTGITGSNQILKIVQPSRYIGLQAILANKVHQYSASVIEKSRVCYVDAVQV